MGEGRMRNEGNEEWRIEEWRMADYPTKRPTDYTTKRLPDYPDLSYNSMSTPEALLGWMNA